MRSRVWPGGEQTGRGVVNALEVRNGAHEAPGVGNAKTHHHWTSILGDGLFVVQ